MVDVPTDPANRLPNQSPTGFKGPFQDAAPWAVSKAGTFLVSNKVPAADEVGVGKMLSMAASAMTSALLKDGPVLILCPSTLTP